MNISKNDAIWFLLIGSIPCNFILLSGFGNLYFSTAVLFSLLFIGLTGIIKIAFDRTARIISFLFIFTLITTIINLLINDIEDFSNQLNFSISHFQLVIAFLIGGGLVRNYGYKVILKFFVLAILLASIRIIITEFDLLLNFSVIRGERIEALFIGGVNNYALLLSIASICLYIIQINKYLRLGLLAYFLLFIIATLSRGAVFALFLSSAIVFLLSADQISKKLIRDVLIFGTLLLSFIAYFIWKNPELIDLIKLAINDRFFALIQNKVAMEDYSSGRALILKDLLDILLNHSNGFQLIFGHGMGSINYSIGTNVYESSHNVYFDVFFRNGLLFFLFFLSFVIWVLSQFFRHRKDCSKPLFLIFLFIHIEFLFNPFLYAVQVGWLYVIFMMIITSHLWELTYWQQSYSKSKKSNKAFEM